jgi:hypothetical protein
MAAFYALSWQRIRLSKRIFHTESGCGTQEAEEMKLPGCWTGSRTLPVSEPEKAELYDAQKLYVRWRFNYGDSRTGLRHRRGKLFFHDAPMIVRRDVNLRDHLLKPVARLTKLSAKDGKQAIDLARAASTVRYRELYGFTNGDPKSVYSAELAEVSNF